MIVRSSSKTGTTHLDMHSSTSDSDQKQSKLLKQHEKINKDNKVNKKEKTKGKKFGFGFSSFLPEPYKPQNGKELTPAEERKIKRERILKNLWMTVAIVILGPVIAAVSVVIAPPIIIVLTLCEMGIIIWDDCYKM